jgi:hypothetical protein
MATVAAKVMRRIERLFYAVLGAFLIGLCARALLVAVTTGKHGTGPACCRASVSSQDLARRGGVRKPSHRELRDRVKQAVRAGDFASERGTGKRR